MPLPHNLPVDNSWIQKQREQVKQPGLARTLPVVLFTATDWTFLTELLPQYTLELNKDQRGIRCRSKIGISDATDQWVPIFQAIKQHFSHRFLEVNHTTCSNHIDFTIYLKKV